MPRPPPRVNPTKHCCAHVSFLRRSDPPRLIAQALRQMPAHTRMLQKPVRMDRNIGATRRRAAGPARFRSRIRLVLGWIASGHAVRHTSGPLPSKPGRRKRPEFRIILQSCEKWLQDRPGCLRTGNRSPIPAFPLRTPDLVRQPFPLWALSVTGAINVTDQFAGGRPHVGDCRQRVHSRGTRVQHRALGLHAATTAIRLFPVNQQQIPASVFSPLGR